MACRRVESAEEAARSFAGVSGTHEVMPVDLADLQPVSEFVAVLSAKRDRLDGLVCHAGTVNTRGDVDRTKDSCRLVSDSNEESAQTTLRCLLSDDAAGTPAHTSASGASSAATSSAAPVARPWRPRTRTPTTSTPHGASSPPATT